MLLVKMRSEPDLSGSAIEIFGHEQTLVAAGADAAAGAVAEVGILIDVGFKTVEEGGAELVVLGRTEVDAEVTVEGLGATPVAGEVLIDVEVETAEDVGAEVVDLA